MSLHRAVFALLAHLAVHSLRTSRSRLRSHGLTHLGRPRDARNAAHLAASRAKAQARRPARCHVDSRSCLQTARRTRPSTPSAPSETRTALSSFHARVRIRRLQLASRCRYPLIRWLERNGYDVSYWTGVDADRHGAALLTGRHRLFISNGHDEYWSGPQVNTTCKGLNDLIRTTSDCCLIVPTGLCSATP